MSSKESYLLSSLFMGTGSEVAPQETSQLATPPFEQSIIGRNLHSKRLENLPELYIGMAAVNTSTATDSHGRRHTAGHLTLESLSGTMSPPSPRLSVIVCP